MNIQSIRGTKDILPPEASRWQYLEEISKKTFQLYGYEEIRTPIIEDLQLFKRSVGETTDIVEKEMYAFSDRGERDICLRPEETASVVRAYLESGLFKEREFIKLYYMGPMFRAERPQAGRMRQFHQVGVEVLGADSPYTDAEVIALLVNIIEKLGIKDYTVKLNSLGCAQDRKKISDLLKDELSSEEKLLCENCKARIKRNVFRVLDCKNEACIRVAQKLPTTLENLCKDCYDHFDKVKSCLDSLGVKYKITPHLVRGLDYYTRTAFEVTAKGLGAQDAIAAGGRYDNLIKELGGPDTPAIGFAMGVERVLLAMEASKSGEPAKQELQLFIASLGDAAYEKSFALLNELRKKGISSDMDFQNKSLKGQLRRANNLNAKFVAILGEDELKKGVIGLKNMKTSEQKEISLEKFVEEMDTLAK